LSRKNPPFGGRRRVASAPFLRFGMSVRFLAVGLAAFAATIVMAALPLVAHG